MRRPDPKAQKALVKRIKAVLKKTKEPPYTWSKRVMGDKTFLWKLEHWGRMPFKKTVKKIEASLARSEKRLAVAEGKNRGN